MPRVRGFLPRQLSPLSIPPAAFVPRSDEQDWLISHDSLHNRVTLESQTFYTPIVLPHGVTISKLTLYGDRDDDLALLRLTLTRDDLAGAFDVMAEITADWITGYSSKYEDTILYPTIDNANYSYSLKVQLTPNDSINDVKFVFAKIEFAG